MRGSAVVQMRWHGPDVDLDPHRGVGGAVVDGRTEPALDEGLGVGVDGGRASGTVSGRVEGRVHGLAEGERTGPCCGVLGRQTFGEALQARLVGQRHVGLGAHLHPARRRDLGHRRARRGETVVVDEDRAARVPPLHLHLVLRRPIDLVVGVRAVRERGVGGGHRPGLEKLGADAGVRRAGAPGITPALLERPADAARGPGCAPQLLLQTSTPGGVDRRPVGVPGVEPRDARVDRLCGVSDPPVLRFHLQKCLLEIRTEVGASRTARGPNRAPVPLEGTAAVAPAVRSHAAHGRALLGILVEKPQPPGGIPAGASVAHAGVEGHGLEEEVSVRGVAGDGHVLRIAGGLDAAAVRRGGWLSPGPHRGREGREPGRKARAHRPRHREERGLRRRRERREVGEGPCELGDVRQQRVVDDGGDATGVVEVQWGPRTSTRPAREA